MSVASEQRALFRRAARLAVALCVLALLSGLPRVAHAAVAGMCDENAQSIAAPLQLVPSHNGELRAISGCEKNRAEQLDSAPAPAPDQQTPAGPIVDRAPPAGFAWSFRSSGDRVVAPEAVRSVARPGWRGEIFRPPRG